MKKNGKTKSTVSLIIVGMLLACVPMFASGQQDAVNTVEVTGNSWAGYINGIQVELEYNEEANAIEGQLINRTTRYLTDLTLRIANEIGNTYTMAIGIWGELGHNDVFPVSIFLDEELRNWTITIDSSNLPQYGVAKVMELFETEVITNRSTSYGDNSNGLSTSIDYDSDAACYSGTIVNYTNKPATISLDLHLDNSNTVRVINNVTVAGNETTSISYDLSSEKGFNTYVPVFTYN